MCKNEKGANYILCMEREHIYIYVQLEKCRNVVQFYSKQWVYYTFVCYMRIQIEMSICISPHREIVVFCISNIIAMNLQEDI